MAETIYKLQPTRTVHLRGFDGRGAAAALHSATETGMKVSGVFRDMADFAVLILWDADNFFEHRSMRYLPDFDFGGMVLEFDIHYDAGAQPIDSPKYSWIDWRHLDYAKADGSVGKIDLYGCASVASGTPSVAAATFNFVENGMQPYDRVIFCYEDIRWEYMVPNPRRVTTSFTFWWQGNANFKHYINVAGVEYSVLENGWSSAQIAQKIADKINGVGGAADPNVSATVSSNTVTITVKSDDGAEYVASGSDGGNYTLTNVLVSTFPRKIRDQINDQNWFAVNPTYALIASYDKGAASLTVKAARYGKVTTNGTTVTLDFVGGVPQGQYFTGLQAGDVFRIVDPVGRIGTDYTIASVDSPAQITLTEDAGTRTSHDYLAARNGYDGNMLAVYALSKNDGVKTAGATATATGHYYEAKKLAGGSSDVTWHVKIDFSALGIDQLRQLWMTFAPRLPDSQAMADTEFQVTFSNWTVTDPNGRRALKVAGPGSVRVSSKDDWVKYAGAGWSEEAGWYEKGYAHRSGTAGDKVRIRYACQFPHDIWIGTSLYKDRGKVDVRLDGDAATEHDFYVSAEPAILSRRRVRQGVPAGEHALEITVRSDKHPDSLGTFFYFDYLEAVLASGVPDPVATYANVSPALDYDTDHTYKLAPQRLVWNLDKMGFHGDVNEYIGVFWWNQRRRVAGHWNVKTLTIGGTWADGDVATLTISGVNVTKTVTVLDDISTITKHLAFLINARFVGIWAETTATAGELKIHTRTPLWGFTFDRSTSGAGTFSPESGNLDQGSEGIWTVDDAATPTLNRAATDWHRDFFQQIAAKGWTATAAFSMELLNPPDDPAANKVWAARFRDNVRVLTATGFGTEALSKITGASNATPIEIAAPGHGYETGDSIVVYGVEGNAAANSPVDAAGNRIPWVVTRTGADTFTLNGSAGSGTYQNGTGFCYRSLKTAHCAFVPKVSAYQKNAYKEMAGLMADAGLTPWLQFGEFVWWFFTNYDASANPSGGMAFYDADTAAAATAALGRPLATFLTPTDDPAVNGYADANFLRQRIKDHCDAISGFVKATYPNAKFEILWPYDVNYPTPTARYKIGGRLNRYVNLPSQWTTKAGSGLDRFKMEGLAFGSSERNIDQAKETIRFPYTVLSWPKADTRYLIPWFNGGCPWTMEYKFALAEGTPHLNLWAFDHLCLLSWPVPLPVPSGSARVL
mgnify:CR=1 FL=1